MEYAAADRLELPSPGNPLSLPELSLSLSQIHLLLHPAPNLWIEALSVHSWQVLQGGLGPRDSKRLVVMGVRVGCLSQRELRAEKGKPVGPAPAGPPQSDWRTWFGHQEGLGSNLLPLTSRMPSHR